MTIFLPPATIDSALYQQWVKPICDAFARVSAAGIVVAAAAGNYASPLTGHFPAGNKDDSTGSAASTSIHTISNGQDICIGGVGILSCHQPFTTSTCQLVCGLGDSLRWLGI